MYCLSKESTSFDGQYTQLEFGVLVQLKNLNLY